VRFKKFGESTANRWSELRLDKHSQSFGRLRSPFRHHICNTIYIRTQHLYYANSPPSQTTAQLNQDAFHRHRRPHHPSRLLPPPFQHHIHDPLILDPRPLTPTPPERRTRNLRTTATTIHGGLQHPTTLPDRKRHAIPTSLSIIRSRRHARAVTRKGPARGEGGRGGIASECEEGCGAGIRGRHQSQDGRSGWAEERSFEVGGRGGLEL